MWESRGGKLQQGTRGMRLIQAAIWLAPGLIVLACLGGILFWYLQHHSYFHVGTVRVYGTDRISQQELVQLAQIHRGMSLWHIDVKEVRARLLRHHWVKDALVRRLYPNELEFIIYERRPRALLESGRSYLIDGEGYVLEQASRKEWPDLPRLVTKLNHSLEPGKRLHDPGAMVGLEVLAQALESALFQHTGITQIEVINPERFLLQTARGKLIVGPRLATAEEKLVFFPTIAEVLRRSARQIDYIDLTVANQIVVKTIARTAQSAGRLQRRGSGSEKVQ